MSKIKMISSFEKKAITNLTKRQYWDGCLERKRLYSHGWRRWYYCSQSAATGGWRDERRQVAGWWTGTGAL